ncbi:MAG: hypothetical protein J5J00_08990 [Deltaproteobacteria bacterium]|nr:hypothetical protein [Deltaproteobacteria bacterium]
MQSLKQRTPISAELSYAVIDLGTLNLAPNRPVEQKIYSGSKAENNRLGLELRRAQANPATLEGEIGFQCAKARIEVLGLTKKRCLELTGLSTSNVLRLAESGKAHITTYRRLLEMWPKLASELDPQNERGALREIEKIRPRVAALLAKCYNLHAANQLLLNLSFLYGQEKFEEAAQIQVASVIARHRSHPGPFHTNYWAVRRLVEEEIRARAQTDNIDTSLARWQHPVLRKLIDYHVQDTLHPFSSSVNTISEGQRFMALVYTLAGTLTGERQDSLCKLGFTSESVDRIVRLEAVDPKPASALFAELVSQEVMPQSVAGDMLKRWEELYSKSPAPQRIDIANQIIKGLEAHRIDLYRASKLLGIDSHEPGTAVRKIIQGPKVTGGVSLHAICSLAAPTLSDADNLTEMLIVERQRMPSYKGRELAYERQLMMQFGLSEKDLPLPKDLPLYAEGSYRADQELVDRIMKLGDNRSIDAVARWIELMRPTTTKSAVGSFLAIATPLREPLADLGLALETLHAVQDGKTVLPLNRLRAMVQRAGLVESEQLICNWHFEMSELYSESPPFGRALKILALSQADHVRGFYDVLAEQSGKSLPMEYHQFLQIVRDYLKGKEPAYERDRSYRLERLLSVLEEGGVDPATIEYLKLCREEPDGAGRLRIWLDRCPEQSPHEKVNAVVHAARLFNTASSYSTLQEAFDAKQEVVNRWSDQPQTPPGQHILKGGDLLNLLPGVRFSDVLDWARSATDE